MNKIPLLCVVGIAALAAVSAGLHNWGSAAFQFFLAFIVMTNEICTAIREKP